jgi:hypothetical protein
VEVAGELEVLDGQPVDGLGNFMSDFSSKSFLVIDPRTPAPSSGSTSVSKLVLACGAPKLKDIICILLGYNAPVILPT